MVGTPTVIAPGAIFLVGEFRLPEEEVAVLAALSSYATAQFFPDVSPLSPLVAAVVEHAKLHLGETAAALPAGSVLLRPAKASASGEGITFDTGPAIAVATAAAIFETAGQSISERRDEILVVAEAGHRAIHDGIGAEGELAAALYGGLIKVVTQASAAPRVEALATPAGLHLVVFQTGHDLFPVGWLSNVRQFAERDCIAYARITNELLEQASRFATELSRGNTTAAIAAAGRYSQCITQLAAAASAPLQSGTFMHAMDLAKEIGGIAKTTSPSRGGMGVAMFATPEAASLFARACQPSLIPLGLELERSGVRCLAPVAVHTPTPTTDLPSISAQVTVRAPLEDRTTEKTLPVAAPEPPPTLCPVVTPAEAPGAEPIPEEVALQPERAARHNRHRLGPAIGAVLVAAVLVAGWLAKSLVHHVAPPVTTQDHAAALQVSSVPAPATPEPTAPAEVTVVPTPSQPAVPAAAPASEPQPPSAKPHASAHHPHALKSGRAQKLAAAPSIQAISKPRPAAPAAPREPSKTSFPRAGKLSHDDF